MIRPTEKWTSKELESFHDEQLDSDKVFQLTEDLRRDSKLRMRLSEVRRMDDLVRTALMQPRLIRAHRFVAPGRFATAACLLLVVGASWLSWNRAGEKADVPAHRLTSASPSPGVRVIFSLPLPAHQKPTFVADSAIGLPPAGERAFLARLNEALVAGHIEEILKSLEAASPKQRQLGYRHIARILQSAQVAESILDRLRPDEQLAVCSQWAAEPTIRPTVFARLRQLSHEPSIASEFDSVLAELSIDPALRTWLRGYQLSERG